MKPNVKFEIRKEQVVKITEKLLGVKPRIESDSDAVGIMITLIGEILKRSFGIDRIDAKLDGELIVVILGPGGFSAPTFAKALRKVQKELSKPS